MFFEELESLKNKFMGRFNLIHILSREKTEVPLNYGRINPAKLAELQPMIDFSKFDSVYILFRNMSMTSLKHQTWEINH